MEEDGVASSSPSTTIESTPTGSLAELHVTGLLRLVISAEFTGLLTAARAGVTGLSDRAATARTSADVQHAAFAAPGALDHICHHPAGDLPGSVVLGFRITDLAIHAWDLARGIGADERLDPRLVEGVWTQLAARADAMAASGLFGDGPSGTLPDDAPLQDRLLDLTGRRP